MQMKFSQHTRQSASTHNATAILTAKYSNINSNWIIRTYTPQKVIIDEKRYTNPWINPDNCRVSSSHLGTTWLRPLRSVFLSWVLFTHAGWFHIFGAHADPDYSWRDSPDCWRCSVETLIEEA